MKLFKPLYLSIPVLAYLLKDSLGFLNINKRPGEFLEHMPEIPLIILMLLMTGYILSIFYVFIAAKENQKRLLYGFLAILFIGTLVRILYSLILPVTNDEGAYLYDALLTSRGSSPFLFSFARSPTLIYPLAVFIKIFGNTVFVGRMFSIIASIGTSVFLFLLGRQFKNKDFGFLAAFIFLLFPPFIYDTIYIHTQSVTMLYLVAALYFLASGDKSIKRLMFSAFFLALAVLVREAVVFYVPLFMIYLLYKFGIKKAFGVMVVFSASYLIPWVYVGLLAGFNKVYLSLYALANMRGGQTDLMGSFVNKIDIFRSNIIYYFGFLEITILGIGSWLISKYKKFAVYLIFLLSAILILITKSIPNSLFIARADNFYLYFLYSSALMSFLSILYFENLDRKNITIRIPGIFIGFVLVPAFFYLIFYANFQTEYWIEFFLPLAIVIAFLLSKNITRYLVFPLIFVYIFNLSAAYRVVQSPPRGTYEVETLHSVVDYLQKNHRNQEVFTGAVVIPFLSGNPLALNITHPAIYCNCTPLPDEVIYGLFPTEREIIDYLNTRKTRVLIVEKITRDVYFAKRPELAKYFNDNYKLETVIGEQNPLEILLRKK